MKNIVISCAIAGAFLAGCESKAGTGAIVGAGGGALVGGLAGGGTGALIGAGAGAVGGAIIGAALDAHDRETLQSNSPDTLDRIDQEQQLTLDDIKSMSKNGLKDTTIMNQIRATHSTYHLTTAQIIDLKKSGVSQNVINYMIRTGE